MSSVQRLEALLIRFEYILAGLCHKVREGFAVQVTGDIDNPSDFRDLSMVEEWIDLARRIGTQRPILYVTASPQKDFERVISSVDEVEIGVHGLTHVDHRAIPTRRLRSEFSTISEYSRRFRFPYLARNLRVLRVVSEFFASDSSMTSARRKPFTPFLVQPEFYEFPVIPPSDTFFRGKNIGPLQAASIVTDSILRCKEKSMYCTLLLHPNQYVIEMMRHMSNVERPVSD